MSVLSFEFAAFAVVVALVLGRASGPQRAWILAGASFLFYAVTDAGHLWLLCVLVALVYGAARLVERATGGLRVATLVTGIGAVMGALAAYRYLVYAPGSMLVLGGAPEIPDAPAADHAFPLGLSFYSLRLVAYLVDVYRGTRAAERHAVRFFAFVALFLEIESGPIERATALLPQLTETPAFDSARVSSGLIRITWGVFKKVVIADYLALPVAAVYGHPAGHSGAVLLLATVAFAFQLYLDFSAYADIAIGAGQVLGLKLTENFRRPYFAASVAEFWNRWHISFSHWLRDYLFLPVAYATDRAFGLRRIRPRTADLICFGVAAVTTMLVAGLWHGTSWTFVVWGGLNGVYLTCGRLTTRWRSRLWQALGVGTGTPVRRLLGALGTFAWLCLAWVFFRSSSLTDAVTILRGILTWCPAASGPGWLPGGMASLGLGPGRAMVSTAFLGGVLAVDLWCEIAKTDPPSLIRRQPWMLRWAFYYGVLLLIVRLGKFGDSSFIYFKF